MTEPVIEEVHIRRALNGWVVSICTVEDGPEGIVDELVFMSPGDMLDKLATLLIKNGNIVELPNRGGKPDHEKTKR